MATDNLNISNFLANFKGGARPNRFMVELTFPIYVGQPTTASRFFVSAAVLPGQTVGVTQVAYQGRMIKVPGDRTFEDWTITVINDENFDLKNAFEKWSNAINEHNRNIRQQPEPIAHFQTALVHQMSVSGDIVKSYKLLNAFPSNISPIQLDWNTMDTVETFQVTLSYSHFETDTTT